MNYQLLDNETLSSTIVGEAITLTAVLAIVAVAVVSVVVYKLFVSGKGSAALGGWKFSWT